MIFSCGVVWAGKDSDLPSSSILYIIFIYMFGFVFPLVIISTSYLKIIKTIRKDLFIKKINWKSRYRLKTRHSGSTKSNTRQNRDRRLTIMVAVMVKLAFLNKPNKILNTTYLSTVELKCLAGFIHALLVSLCLHLYSRGCRVQGRHWPLLLCSRHTSYDDQDFSLYWPNHLLLLQSPGDTFNNRC